jgi:hypothetical protein
MSAAAASTVPAVEDSNRQQLPVLIPITVPSRSYQDDIDDRDHETGCSRHKPQPQQHQLQEWAMIEINGELLLPPTTTSTTTMNDGTAAISGTGRTTLFDTRRNIELGSISFEACQTAGNVRNQNQLPPPVIPIMIIGTHELRGKIIELPQPFLCLQKHIHDPGQSHNNSSNVDAMPLAEHETDPDTATTTTTNATEYVIRGIVKYKFIFNQYPKTIMR